MERFDDQVENVINRGGRASFWLTIIALALLLFGLFCSAWAGAEGGALAAIGILLAAVASAALLYGVAMIIDLLGMHLMETWRQGRPPEGRGRVISRATRS
jgi:hypothetical protein